MDETLSIKSLFKRLIWDLRDKNERAYYFYFLIYQIPCSFGDRVRARFVKKHVCESGSNLKVLAGARFRSIEKLKLGDNVSIGFDNFIQSLGGVTIGDNSSLGPGTKIWSVNHNYKNKNMLVGDQSQTEEAVVLGNDVWLASNVFINAGVNLPDGCVVCAGSVVGKKNYKPFSILAGNPARVIGFRDDL